MEITTQGIKRISAVLGGIMWVFLLLMGLDQQVNPEKVLTGKAYFLVKGLVLNIFVLTIFTYSYYRFQEIAADFTNLLWRVFITALLCTFFSGVLMLILIGTNENPESHSVLIYTIFFHIEFGLMIIFLMTAFAAWRRMILYEKGRFTQVNWRYFEYALLISLILYFFQTGKLDISHSIPFALFVLWSIPLYTNVRWIAHLNFNQKLLAISQFIIILFCLIYYFTTITSYFKQEPLVVDDLSKSIFSAVLYTFITLYTVVSILVLLFNLPTSSIYEKKFKEISVFQRLSDSILEGKSEQQVFEVLLDSSLSSVKADAGWVEIAQTEEIISRNIGTRRIQRIKLYMNRQGFDNKKIKKFGSSTFSLQRKKLVYGSILAIPISTAKENFGTLVLLNDLNHAFDNMMLSLVNTFVNQAGISLHNFRLLSKLVEQQRFKNELQIARRVQQGLFPQAIEPESSAQFEIFVRTESATEVGGDYYDFYKISENKYAVIIADVAGSGIPAAFNMAQMKGIFQVLVRMNLNPDKFLIYANAALSDCLKKSEFITATYYFIDTEYKKIYLSRAGHCPTLFYTSQNGEMQYFENKGLGLGIVRNEKYNNFVEVNIFDYQNGDLMVLYTDGIIESKSKETGEIFGYDRFKECIEEKATQPLEIIYNYLMGKVFSFTESDTINDDFTILLIRF